MRYYKVIIMAQIEKPQLPPIKIGSSTRNGTGYYYLQTYTFHYDPKTKKCIRDSQKTVGKTKDNQRYGLVVWKDEFLKEHPELENFDVYTTKNGLEFKARDPETINVINPVRVEKKLAGATWAIDKIMAQIGIGDALRQVFKKRNKCFKLASVIEYMLIQRTNVMHGYAPFSKIHWLPWAYPLNDTQLNTLFKGITQDDTMALFKALNREYRRKFGDEFFQKMFLALDSTSISTYSKKLSYAEYGHNKDGDDTKQINFLLVCEESSGLPIYGKIYKGNVVDVSTVKNLLADLALVTGVSEDEASNNYIFVTDRGYESDDNLQDFARHNYSFVMRSRMANRWILDEVDDAIPELRNSNNFDNYLNQTCCTKKVVYKYDPFPVNGKNKSNTAKLDLFLHMFFNEDIQNESFKNLRFNVTTAKNIYNETIQKLREQRNKSDKPTNEPLIADIGPTQKFIDNYCKLDADGFALIDDDKLRDYVKYKGIMVLVTDKVTDAKEAYFAYYRRQTVEQDFETFKSRLKGNRPYVSDDRTLQGRFLCQLLATAISNFISGRIREYEKSDAAKSDNVRFDNYSQARLISDLDTIMLTSFKDGYYFDEIQGKYRTLYNALGVAVPEANCKYPNDNGDAIDDEEIDDYAVADPALEAIGGELE